MDYLDFSKEGCRMMIKSLKNSISAQRGCLYLNLFLALFDGWLVYSSPNHLIPSLATGALIGNVLWLAINLSHMKSDLKLEKERLSHLDKLQEDENFQGALRQLKNSKDYYDKLINIAIETQNRANSIYRESTQQESLSPKAEK
ncbi:MAG TPA: hypothetical protein VK590_06245 [Saprospiraceae bacterium]|nr:hypothetical protein [Saprospiraceae bacterium]